MVKARLEIIDDICYEIYSCDFEYWGIQEVFESKLETNCCISSTGTDTLTNIDIFNFNIQCSEVINNIDYYDLHNGNYCRSIYTCPENENQEFVIIGEAYVIDTIEIGIDTCIHIFECDFSGYSYLGLIAYPQIQPLYLAVIS